MDPALRDDRELHALLRKAVEYLESENADDPNRPVRTTPAEVRDSLRRLLTIRPPARCRRTCTSGSTPFCRTNGRSRARWMRCRWRRCRPRLQIPVSRQRSVWRSGKATSRGWLRMRSSTPPTPTCRVVFGRSMPVSTTRFTLNREYPPVPTALTDRAIGIAGDVGYVIGAI
jgi:hypothetical protein